MVSSSSLTTLTFGTAGTGGNDNQLDFSTNPHITSIGQNAFAGTKFTEVDLTALPATLSVGADAFSNIVGLSKVTLSESQATRINPGVFSIADSAGGEGQDWSITITGGSSQTFSPTTWPSTTVTVANNLNRLDKVQTIDLAQTNITTLEGGVLFGNEKITTLKLSATATQWKLTEPKSYESAPIGYSSDKASSGLLKNGSIEFLNFGQSSNTPATSFSQIDWSLVANILNMFGRVEGGDRDNLSVWAEGFQGPDLTAESVKSGWKNGNGVGGKNTDVTLDKVTNGQSATKTVNGVTWTYKNDSGSITLTVDTSGSNKNPNLYRAGYTNNPYASYQVGFATTQDGAKIDTTKTVEVKLTLVGK